MCIVFYALERHGYKLIIASNREEFLDRPTTPAAWHTFAPIARGPNGKITTDSETKEEDQWVLSGRDLSSGGTWLGMTRDLRIAVLTNIRIPPVPTPPNPPSRGLLLKEFLSPEPSKDLPSVHDYLSQYEYTADSYEGFNLLFFKLHPPANSLAKGENPVSTEKGQWGETEVGYLSNRPHTTLMEIHPASRPYPRPKMDEDEDKEVGDVCGLSNTPLTEPWPKVIDGEARMSKTMREWHRNGESEEQLIERLMSLLQQTKPLDSIADLSECTCLHPVKLGGNPDIPAEATEKTRWYGTRVSTLVLVKDSGETTFIERDIFVQNDKGESVKGNDERRFTFQAV